MGFVDPNTEPLYAALSEEIGHMVRRFKQAEHNFAVHGGPPACLGASAEDWGKFLVALCRIWVAEGFAAEWLGHRIWVDRMQQAIDDADPDRLAQLLLDVPDS